METNNTIEMLSFNLKLIGKKSKKNVLISAGKTLDKERMLPAVAKLMDFNIAIYATEGTSLFLDKHGIKNQQVFKITEKKEPNIKSFLDQDRFDIVINILTGNHDYDEASDCNLIRNLSIENGIPLITDVDVAIMTIGQMVKKEKAGVYKYKIDDDSEPWNLKNKFLSLVSENGGLACYHAHFDKAYLISLENLKLSQVSLQKKWQLYRYLKENYTYHDLKERMLRCVEKMKKQGITRCRTFIDADSTIKLFSINVANEVKNEQNDDNFKLEIAVQPLQGVFESESRKYFEEACEKADIVGGLPSKDRPQAEKHIDIIMEIAKKLGKKVDVHIDQENNPYEDETELLAKKTIEHGLEGRVSGVHAISLAAKSAIEQDRIINLVKDAGMNIIICPSAAISMKPHELNAPIHNSIAPFAKLLEAEVPVYLGVDNIYDLFMPLVDGDMWFECRLLMEACRFYDIEKVAEIACNKNGFDAA